MVKIKRAFEKKAPDDGYRVLVDRAWPRGIPTGPGAFDSWAQELAPSAGLREFYHRDPDKWPEFRERLREELKAAPSRKTLELLAETAKTKTVTLLHGSRQMERNNATVVKELIESIV
jgi:uncharacterized protein YeaO (DUF488 family)